MWVPLLEVFLNKVQPTKAQRYSLYLVHVYCSFLICTILLYIPGPAGSDDVDAIRTHIGDLFSHLVTVPLDGTVIIFAILADLGSRAIRMQLKSGFFKFRLRPRQLMMDHEGQMAQMRYWHDLAITGSAVCVACFGLSWLVILTLCSIFPQPRVNRATQAFLVSLIWSHVVLPIIAASFTTLMLVMARKRPTVDGLPTLIP